jgi:hypothetical protein
VTKAHTAFYMRAAGLNLLFPAYPPAFDPISLGESNLGLQCGEMPKQLGLILAVCVAGNRAFTACWNAPRRRTRDSATCSGSAQAGKIAAGGGGNMIPPETVAIKPEAKKVTSQRSWVRRPRHKLAPRGLVSIRLSAPGASRPTSTNGFVTGWSTGATAVGHAVRPGILRE